MMMFIHSSTAPDTHVSQKYDRILYICGNVYTCPMHSQNTKDMGRRSGSTSLAMHQHSPEAVAHTHDHKGRPKACWKQLDIFLAYRRDQEHSDRHISESKRIISDFFRSVGEKRAQDIDKDDVKSYLSRWEPGRTRIYYRTHINQFLLHFSNGVISSLRFKDPRDLRPNVRWLSMDEIQSILSQDLDPHDEIVIRLALEMALRRVEIERLRLKDINWSQRVITVRGKGAVLKSVPMSRDFPDILRRYLIYRTSLIEKHPGEPVPRELVLTEFRGHLSHARRSCIDNVCIRISDRVGFRFSMHDLRRTWARQAFELKVPYESIGYILGHRDPRQTLRYIGVDVDHGREAVQIVADHRQDVKSDGRDDS